MSGGSPRRLADDRAARAALLAALALGGALALVRLWAEQAAAPESWWRMRAVLGAAALAAVAAALCLALAWSRRTAPASAVPLAAAAAVLLALAFGPG